jgi:hypothetical protein
MSGSLILNVNYGFDIKSADDPYILIAERSMEAVGEAINPSSFSIDRWPIRAFFELETWNILANHTT